MASPVAAIDFETYYSSELSVTIQGTWNYVNHKDFDAYLLSVSTSTGIRWVGHPADFDWSQISGKEWGWLHHNASFDELILHRLRSEAVIPDSARPGVTHCTADLVSYLGSPRSLSKAAEFLLKHPPLKKSVRDSLKGKRWADCSEDFKEEVRQYALADADVCLKLWQEFGWKWPLTERAISRHTRMMAWCGIPIDREKLDKAIPSLETQNFEAQSLLPWVAEGEKPLSPKALAVQCRSVGIVPPPSLAEDSESCRVWEDEYSATYPWVSAMRTVRRTNTLLKKLQAMRQRIRSDTGDMSFGMLYFGAATTGRFSGSDGVNVQNLPGSLMFSVNVREMLCAPPGFKFINADLSQIEPRCLAWLTGNEKMLSAIRSGIAIYEAHARASMGWVGGKLKAEDKDLYALAKARVLALGYGAGAEKFQIMARTMCGLELTARQADEAVDDFRRSSPEICGRGGIWQSLEQGMVRSARNKEDYLVELPSGRLLHYFRPSNMGGLSAETAFKGGMARRRWWGGSLTENLTQATARDVFARMILRVEEAGYPVLFHVHDELTALAPEDKAEEALKTILDIMRTPPVFMPDLPLDAEGGIFDSYPLK